MFYSTKTNSSHKPKTKEVLDEMKRKVTRQESRERLEKLSLAGELVKVIRKFFPDLMELLKGVRDPRNQSYITYSNYVLMMTRILSAIFYISSMRKSSQELNFRMTIENIGQLCKEELEELPYWETINQYLERVEPEELQHVVNKLVYHLIRSRKFEGSRIRNKYWQVILDATKLVGSKKELDGNYIFFVHDKGKETQYTEYGYYVLEVKLVLSEDIVVSIMSEFIENKEEEYKKQDCERSAAARVMARLKEMYPHLPICISGDSLYACESFFRRCEEYGWKFLCRFKGGSIPTVQTEYEALKKLQNNEQHQSINGKDCVYDFVTEIDYNGVLLNYVYYSEKKSETKAKAGESDNSLKTFTFLTDLPVNRNNVQDTVRCGRRRWLIENLGFNEQKKHGYYIEHLFSRNCCAMKNHYYLIQIAHMISQIMDAWKTLWTSINLSKEQKHKRILDSWKTCSIAPFLSMDVTSFQIRLE